MTLLELFKKNGISPNSKSNNCRTYQIRYTPTDDKRFLFLVKCNEEYSDPKGHIVSFYFEEKGLKVNRRNISPLNSQTRVHCHCPAYVYWGSAYNATKGKFKIKYKPRELREPNVRDPKRQNLICKHLVNATKSFKSKNFTMLGKGRMSVVSSIDELPTIAVSECLSSVSSYIADTLDENLKGDYGTEFIANLNEDNFENELLKIGMIN